MSEKKREPDDMKVFANMVTHFVSDAMDDVLSDADGSGLLSAVQKLTSLQLATEMIAKGLIKFDDLPGHCPWCGRVRTGLEDET